MIPKKIHVSWKDKNILFESKNPIAVNGLQKLRDLNPDYVIEISNDDDVHNYIKQYIDKDDWLNIKDRNIVEKTDLWRLLKMSREGGIYVDIDRYCNIPFDDIIKDTDVCILPTHYKIDFSQDIMISAPQQDIFLKAIELNLGRREFGCRDVLTLGPITYFHAITEIFFGRQLERFMSGVLWKRVIKNINEREGYRTFEERPVNNMEQHRTILFKYTGGTVLDSIDTHKPALYEESGTSHWTECDNVFGDKIFGK